MILRAEQVDFAYRDGKSVLAGVSLELRAGLVTGLFGPNGSGKSTLLRCMNGSLVPTSGAVWLDGRSIISMTRRELAHHVAVVPQDTPTNVPLTVRQMVALGRYAHGTTWGHETPEDDAVVDACLARLDVDRLMDRPFSQLSGGERQRVVIARALAQRACVLLMDEPHAHLDLTHQLEVYRLARALATEGQSVLMICHDLLIAPLMVDVAAVMNRGRIVESGIPSHILNTRRLVDVFGTSATITWDESRRVSACFGSVVPA